MVVRTSNEAPAPSGASCRGKTALVLAGGAARGAYEVGVVKHIVEHVARSLGREVPLDLLCGTSIGAINVSALAAWADEPRERIRRLEAHWLGLKLDETVHVDGIETLAMGLGLLGIKAPKRPRARLRGGILDVIPFERIVHNAPFARIGEHLRAGRIAGVSLSTTHAASGRTVMFVQRAEPGVPRMAPDPTVELRAVELTPAHAMASGAIPLLFPAVKLDGQFHVDGGLRQNTPILPARVLGAEAMVVVNTRYQPGPADAGPAIEEEFPGPQFLLGKALDALLLDSIDAELEQLKRRNRVIDAGVRRYGPDFVSELNLALGDEEPERLHPLRLVLVRATQNIGALAADYARSPDFKLSCRGPLSIVLHRLAEGEARREADFLSYLLFDGEFARRLIALGEADAAAQHEALCGLFEQALEARGA